VTLSDRNAKTEFKPVDGSDILERISKLPITSWTFKSDPNYRHMGPTAQDFHAAFGLNGDDDTHISLSDSAGVSLAAIRELNKRLQRLNERLRVKDAQIAALERQVKSSNETFSARLAKLEQQVPTTPQSMTAYVRRFAH
ncbi:MAG TPA: tail fiber domain-containing protein, partial [Steroidobacteraceae bacterium]|nr:tail fiber domain-containing protein [Steroidobacteraceae bacterium]